MHRMPDDEFVRRLPGAAVGVIDAVLREAMDLALPTLRADFELVETLADERPPPIDCPLRVFGGMIDPIVKLDQLLAWRQLTTGSFAVRMMPGDHFFPETARAVLLREIARGLEPRLRGAA
jgi:surfactin synthase thioesterase subunit